MLIQTMNKTGDSRHEYDVTDPAQLAQAQAVVNSHLAQGGMAFKMVSGTKGEQLKSFDQSAERVILSKPLSGG